MSRPTAKPSASLVAETARFHRSRCFWAPLNTGPKKANDSRPKAPGSTATRACMAWKVR
jgi:hypothetical protein